MRYLSLANGVPKVSALEPKAATWLYELTSRIPLVRTTYRRFVGAVLGMGIGDGYALDLGTGPGSVAVDPAQPNSGLEVTGLDLGAHSNHHSSRYRVIWLHFSHIW